MRSSARTCANRENAKRSTGPRTKEGKSRVAKNALRHGLAVPIEFDKSQSTRIHALARVMAPDEADEVLYAAACRVAEAQFDLRRIWGVRFKLLTDPQARTAKISRRMNIKVLKVLCRLQGKNFKEELEKVSVPDDAGKDVPLESVVGDVVSECMRLDRYERRAFSRLKAAMRTFEELTFVRPDACVA